MFFIGGADFKINIYDSKGNKSQTIQHKFEKIKIQEKLKNKIVQFFKTDPATKQVYQYMKPILFPEHFPAIRTFFVSKNKIFVLTYKEENKKNEFIILDMNGKLLKKVYLPLQKKDQISFYPYTINDGILYQLMDDEETEEWGLEQYKIL